MPIHIFSNDIDVSACSITGRRKDNQDSFAWIAFTDSGIEGSVSIPDDAAFEKELFLGIVCDGMGGMSYGKEASQTVVDRTMEWIITVQKESLDALIEEYRRIVLPSIEKDIMQSYRDSGTTLSMLIGMEDRWVSLHLGDSRLYAIHSDGSEFRTEDHSPVESMRKTGLITEDEMEDHPMKNLISWFVGGGYADDLEINPLGDWFRIVLCSDGAYGCMSRREFIDLISTSGAEDIVKTCYECGSSDNITVISISHCQ